MVDVLVQTRVPSHVAKWITKRAGAEGDTVAGWLRRLLTREASMSVVKAWVDTTERSAPRMIQFNPPPATYYLETLREQQGSTVYGMLFGDNKTTTGQPIRGEQTLLHDTWFSRPNDFRVVVGGSPHRYVIANTIYNQVAARWEMTLEIDRGYQYTGG